MKQPFAMAERLAGRAYVAALRMGASPARARSIAAEAERQAIVVARGRPMKIAFPIGDRTLVVQVVERKK